MNMSAPLAICLELDRGHKVPKEVALCPTTLTKDKVLSDHCHPCPLSDHSQQFLYAEDSLGAGAEGGGGWVEESLKIALKRLCVLRGASDPKCPEVRNRLAPQGALGLPSQIPSSPHPQFREGQALCTRTVPWVPREVGGVGKRGGNGES